MYDPNLDPVRYDRDRRSSSYDNPYAGSQDAPSGRGILATLVAVAALMLLVALLSFASSDNEEATTQTDPAAAEQTVILPTAPAE